MRRIGKLVFSFFLPLVVSILIPRPAPAEVINWVSYPEGITRAARLERPLMVYFHSRFCRICSVMEKKVFSEPEIAAYLNSRLVPVRADISRERELVVRYRVPGSPVVYFLKPDGAPIDFLAGYLEPARFMRILRYIGEGIYSRMTFGEYLEKSGGPGP